MDIIKLCGVGLLCAVAVLIMKQLKGELAALVRVGGVLIIFGALALFAADIITDVTGLVFTEGLSGYARIMMKALGLALVSRICSDICRDMGETTVAGGIELGGRLAILSLCLPLIGELMGYAKGLMEL
jgi:stage III sporulation protein AD